MIIKNRNGGQTKQITKDHKPEEPSEKERIINAGGKIYQTSARSHNNEGIIIGPHRVFPGRLSVSRTFGDPEAKLVKYGGNPNVVISCPEIFSFRITNSYDFIALGCDGIFDKLSSQDTVRCAWNTLHCEKTDTIHSQCAIAVDSIIKNALYRRSLDNVTSVIIGFSNFKHIAFPKQISHPKKEIITAKINLKPTTKKCDEISNPIKKDNNFVRKRINEIPAPMTERGSDRVFEFKKPKLLRRLHE